MPQPRPAWTCRSCPTTCSSGCAAVLPAEASTANPVDVTGSVTGHQFGDALDILLTGSEIDAVLAVLTPGRLTSVDGLTQATGQAARRTAKPVLVSVLGQAAAVAVAPPPAVPVVCFDAPEEAVRALARAVEYGRWRRRPVGALPELATSTPRAPAVPWPRSSTPSRRAASLTRPPARRCSAATASR